MKILVVSQYFYPENFRINDIVAELLKRGHEITVVTGLPNYPEGKIYDGYENSYKNVSNYLGANVYRCKLRPRYKGIFNLVLNYFSFVKKTNKLLKKIEPEFDIICFYEPSPISSGLPAIKYGKKHKIKTIIFNMDIWPDCVRDRNGKRPMSKSNPIFLISKLISRYVYSHFDLIINKCDEFGDYLNKELKIKKNKMTTLFEPAEDIYLNVSNMPVDNGIIDFMFIGNIGKSQNCDQIVRAYSKIKKYNTKLHFVGDGSFLQTLKDIVKRLKLDNDVIFHKKCSLEEVINYYNIADICILTLSNSTTSGLTPPAKLASYMASSRPIIASIDGAAKSIIENSNCGFVCEANNVEELTKLMQTIIDNPSITNGLGKNGREYYKKMFTLKKHVDELEDELKRLVKL